MITKEQLTELHAAAEAAHRPGVFWYQQDMLERFTRHFTGAELDATYIAASNPAMVLELIADNEAKAARIAELEREVEDANQARREAQLAVQEAQTSRDSAVTKVLRELGQRIAELEKQRDAAQNFANCAGLELGRVQDERDHWKANHENQVQRARILIERDDLPLERVKAYERYSALEQDAARYAALRHALINVDPKGNRGPIEMAIKNLVRQVHAERGVTEPTEDEFDAAIDGAMMIQGHSSG